MTSFQLVQLSQGQGQNESDNDSDVQSHDHFQLNSNQDMNGQIEIDSIEDTNSMDYATDIANEIQQQIQQKIEEDDEKIQNFVTPKKKEKPKKDSPKNPEKSTFQLSMEARIGRARLIERIKQQSEEQKQVIIKLSDNEDDNVIIDKNLDKEKSMLGVGIGSKLDPKNIKFLFTRQGIHLILIIGLLYALMKLKTEVSFSENTFLSLSFNFWFNISIYIAILHQLQLWFMTRVELGTQFITQTFQDNAFSVYKNSYIFFIILRIFSISVIANLDYGSFTLPINISKIYGASLFLIFLISIIYLLRTYGEQKLFGIDIFDESIRLYPETGSKTLYTVGMLLFWSIAIWNMSLCAIVIAAFYHVYVMVHYYCTEIPNFEVMYGGFM